MGKNNVFKTLLSLCQGELSSLIFFKANNEEKLNKNLVFLWQVKNFANLGGLKVFF